MLITLVFISTNSGLHLIISNSVSFLNQYKIKAQMDFSRLGFELPREWNNLDSNLESKQKL